MFSCNTFVKAAPVALGGVNKNTGQSASMLTVGVSVRTRVCEPERRQGQTRVRLPRDPQRPTRGGRRLTWQWLHVSPAKAVPTRKVLSLQRRQSLKLYIRESASHWEDVFFWGSGRGSQGVSALWWVSS